MDTPLSTPWHRPSAESSNAVLDEATREIKEGHDLFGIGLVSCVARCGGCDDTVFRCDDGTFVMIHLTWSKNERPPWPNYTRLGSFIALELFMDQHEH